jgi:hypothetical protein
MYVEMNSMTSGGFLHVAETVEHQSGLHSVHQRKLALQQA